MKRVRAEEAAGAVRTALAVYRDRRLAAVFGLGVASGLPVRFLVLAPAAEAAPDSSLSHMFGRMVAARGDAGSRFLVEPEATLDVDAVLGAVEEAAHADAPLALCGTAFAFVHLLEALDARGEKLALPADARVMETGGFKGRSRIVPREELHAWIARGLGVAPARIVNQYGMTELGSQFYDSVLFDPEGPRRKVAPPWARVRMVAPESGAEVGEGELGMIRILDLANTGSVHAIETADLGRRIGEDGFEVEGRAPGAEERGCSIAADEMLGG